MTSKKRRLVLLPRIVMAEATGEPPRRRYTVRWRCGDSLVVCDADNLVVREGSELAHGYRGRPLAEFVRQLREDTAPAPVQVLPQQPLQPRRRLIRRTRA